jgi:hypothetical protein
MDWRSRSEFEITDLGDGIEVIYAFWRTSELLGIVILAIFTFSLVNSFRKGNETRLIVRPDGFIAEGNIDSAFRERITVSVDDIYGIDHFIGYDGSPSGLYARGTWSSTCLIPGIDEESCGQIKLVIEEKFPDMYFGQGELSGVFGTGPDILTLGLNKPAACVSKKFMGGNERS